MCSWAYGMCTVMRTFVVPGHDELAVLVRREAYEGHSVVRP